MLAKKPRYQGTWPETQSSEKGSILDALNHCPLEEYPEVNTKKAKSAIVRFFNLLQHNFAQKTEVIVEHFRNFTWYKIEYRRNQRIQTV
jgi:type I restriction enzyme R subunit